MTYFDMHRKITEELGIRYKSQNLYRMKKTVKILSFMKFQKQIAKLLLNAVLREDLVAYF